MTLQELFQYLFNEDEWRKKKVQQLPRGLDDRKPIPFRDNLLQSKPDFQFHIDRLERGDTDRDISKLETEIRGLQ